MAQWAHRGCAVRVLSACAFYSGIFACLIASGCRCAWQSSSVASVRVLRCLASRRQLSNCFGILKNCDCTSLSVHSCCKVHSVFVFRLVVHKHVPIHPQPFNVICLVLVTCKSAQMLSMILLGEGVGLVSKVSACLARG